MARRTSTSFARRSKVILGLAGAALLGAVLVLGAALYLDLRSWSVGQVRLELELLALRLGRAVADGSITADPADAATFMRDSAPARGKLELLSGTADAERSSSLAMGWGAICTEPVDGTSWSLQVRLTEAELFAALAPHLLPYAGLALVMLAASALTYATIRRQVVKPALALAAHVAAENDDRPQPVPDLPELWRDWARSISEAFRARRELAVTTARFSAAAESLLDGLAVWDRDDRLIYFNSRYPEHLTPGLRAGLALGKQFDAWIRESAAADGVYHESMGADFVERRLAVRRQPFSDHEHQLRDGRWMRIRESKMPDGGTVLLTSDITQRHRQREALAEQSRKLEAVLANIAEGVTLLDPEGNCVLANDGFLRMYGFGPEFARPGIPVADFIRDRLGRGDLRAGEDQANVTDDLEATVAARAELLRRTPSTEFEEARADGRAILVRRQRLPDGLLVSTYIDITDRKRREQELAVLATAVEQAGDSIEIATADYRLVYVNPAFERLTGWKAAEAVGHKPAELLRSDTQDGEFFEEIDRQLHGGKTWNGRLISRHHDGHLLVQDATISPLREDSGRLTHYVAVKRDVAARERAEAALRASEQLKQAVLEAALDCVIGMDEQGRIVEFNPAAEQTFGYARADVLGRDLGELLIPPRLRHAHRTGMERHLATGRTRVLGRRVELPAMHASGREFPVELIVVSAADGGRGGYLAYLRDISEQKRTEQAIRASEERYRGVVEAQTEFILRQLPEGHLTFTNDAYCRHVGLSREQLLDPSWNDLDLFDHVQRDALVALWARLTPEAPTATIELRPRLPGDRRPIELWVERGIFDADGHLVEIQSVGRDITEQRAAEAALRASEERFRTIVDDQAEFITRFGADYRLTFVNHAFARHLGRSREQLIGTSVLDLMTPEQEARFTAQLADLTAAAPTVTYEMSGVAADGSRRIEEWTDRALFDGNDRLLEYQSVGRDITDQKLAVQELRESQQRYRAVIQDQTEVIGRFDADLKLTFANAAHCRLLGRTADSLVGEDFFASVPAELAAALRHRLRSLTPDNPVDYGENEKVLPDGSRRWFAWTNRALFDERGVLVGYQSVGRDITEQKAAEDALRESEATMRAIAEGVPVPLAIARLDRPEILFLNERAVEAFALGLGLQREAIERVWAERADRDRMLAAVDAVGRVDGLEVRMHRADGAEAWILFSARLITYAGEPAFLAVMTDITERRAMEEALRASEARLAAFLANSPVGMYLKDSEGRYIMANPRMTQVFGCPAEDAVGRSAAELLPPAEAALVQQYDQEVISTGSPSVREEYLDGQEAFAWTMVIRFPVRDSSGRITQIGGFDVDITAQKRAEHALRASEARLAAFLENAPVGMYLKDLEGRYVLANPEMGKIFGRPAAEMIGRTAADTAVAHDLKVVARSDGEVRRTGRPLIVEEHAPELDAYRWSLVFRFPLRDAAGDITHLGGFHVDTTDSKRAEAALRESEQRFRRFAEAHPVPLVVLGLPDTKVLFVSPAYIELFQYTPAELDALDKHVLWADPAQRAPFFERLSRDGVIRDFEVMVRRKDGHVFPAMLNTHLMEYGGAPAMVTSVLDLSRQKAAEAEVERQREVLHQSEKLAALGGLLAGVAHELNNPLSVVVGYSSMLEELAADDATRRRAQRVHAAADRCARIVKSFLAMARQKPPQFGAVDINAVVEAALELAAYGLRTADVEIIRTLDPDLPQIWGDADQLHQVFTNLIVNAQQALTQRADGRRRLLLRSRVRRGRVEVTVGDNGPGMSPEVRSRIFEPFFSTKPTGVGTGVGLSLCHALVTAHDGWIEVFTAEGKGSRFKISLPTMRVAELAEPLPAAAVPIARRGRVLVVDDEAEIAELVRDVLGRDGFQVSVAASGREALERLRAESIDVIVSDLRMPDLDGPSLWRELKASRPELARRMVFVTGDTLSGEASSFLREANALVLDKPLDLEELRRCVTEIAARNGA